jgi:FkbM family methyltransferase
MGYLLRLATDLRSYGRRAGVTRLLNLLRVRRSRVYEDQFGAALLSAVQPGDCVWDVGANVGHYSITLAHLVGEAGCVVAFEPAPMCADKLRERAPTGLSVIESALGNVDGFLPLTVADNPLGSTHSLCEKAGRAMQVRVTTGDGLIARRATRSPNVIKIDVEGFELEVLEGLDRTLRGASCRAVFVEVHFGILDRRGHRHAPSQVVSFLQATGFRTRWVDASHIAALRN